MSVRKMAKAARWLNEERGDTEDLRGWQEAVWKFLTLLRALSV
jgi:hypothetical protein